MHELERLAQDVFFEVADQLRDRVGPCLGAVVAGSGSVGVVSLIDKERWPRRISLSPACPQLEHVKHLEDCLYSVNFERRNW